MYLRDNEIAKHVDHCAEGNQNHQTSVIGSTGYDISPRVPRVVFRFSRQHKLYLLSSIMCSLDAVSVVGPLHNSNDFRRLVITAVDQKPAW